MTYVFQNKRVQAIRVFTGSAVVDGLLTITLMGRTLDELNARSRDFLSLDSPALVHGDIGLSGSQLAINKALVLLATETEVVDAGIPIRVPLRERRAGTRSVLALSVGAYRIEGYVQVLGEGSPLERLYKMAHPFLALTAASVVGPGQRFATRFLAVNRTHILSAQETMRMTNVTEEEPEFAGDRRGV